MKQNSEHEQTEPVSAVIGVQAASGSHDAPAGPMVRIERASGKPLRLNNGRLNLHGKTDAADAFSRIKDYLLTICGPWSRHHHVFINAYFAFVDAQCERHRTELGDILAPFGSVYSYRDFRFSAWLPLPLAVVDSSASTPPAGQPWPRADFLLWSGTEFIAVELCGHTSRSNKRIREREQLQQAGVRIVDIHLSQLRTDPGALFVSAFPPGFSHFWAGERFPSGPLKPENARFVLTPQR